MSEAAATPEINPRGFAAELRGFGLLGIVAFLLIAAGVAIAMPIAAVSILLWALASKTSWRELGFVRPKSWIGGLVAGVALGVVLKFALKAVILPLLGADPVNHLFHDLAGDPGAALRFAIYAIIGAGIAEEIVFRGYLFERMGKLFGTSAVANLLTLIIATSIFAVLHYQQGLFGIVNAGVTGGVIGLLYLLNGRSLFVPMVAHATFDVVAAGMIYLNLETAVAHLVFK